MRKVYLLIVLALLMNSCRPLVNKVIFKVYGIKKPRVENAESIKKKAHKFGLDTNNIVTVHSDYFGRTLKGQSIPDAHIFDSSGRYIEYKKADTSCNAGLFSFIPELAKGKTYFKIDSPSLNLQLAKFRDLNGKTLKPLEAADYYVLIYWTVWTGRLNKDHVKIWEELAAANKNCKIKVIKVNLDLQEYWDKEKRDKIIKALQKKK